MKTILEHEALQEEFRSGTAPAALDGFYRGELTLPLPEGPLESVGASIGKTWLPWKGKVFAAEMESGVNVLPSYIAPVLRLLYGNQCLTHEERDIVHAFPFKTSITRGIFDDLQVMKLDYDLPVNPPRVRAVVDELVRVGENSYLGKAHLRERIGFRTVAFFRLER